VLGDFHLLDARLSASIPSIGQLNVRLSEGSTVSGSVLSGDSDLLCSFGLDVSLALVWSEGKREHSSVE